VRIGGEEGWGWAGRDLQETLKIPNMPEEEG